MGTRRLQWWSLSSDRRAWTVLGVAIAAHIALGVLLFDPKPFVGGDNAGYMVLAESVESGRGYRDIYLPGAPRHAQYPPVYPVILAAAGALGAGLTGLKGLSLIFTAGSLVPLFLLARRRLGNEGAVGLVIAFALNPVLLYYSHWVLSEAPFVLLTLVALWAAERMEGADRYLAVAVTAGSLAYLTRAAGLPLLAALLIVATWRRWWRALAWTAAIECVVVGGWWIWGRIAASQSAQRYSNNFLLIDPYNPGQGYVGPGELLARTVNNVRLYAIDVLPQSIGGGGAGGINLFPVLAGLAILALAVVAWVRRIRQGRALEWFTLLYVGLICIWPQVWTDRRFLLPLLPILLLYAFDGLVWCFEFARARRPGWVLPATGGLLLVLALPHHVRGVRFNQECLRYYRQGDELACYPPPWRAFVESAYWVRDNTAADAVVVNRKPRLFYYFSGRRGDVYPFTSDAERVLAFLDQIQADYVVVDALSATTYRYLVPAIRTIPERFQLLRSIGQGAGATHVLGYLGPTPSSSGTAGEEAR